MGTISEEPVRRFNEENNEEAGEHLTPRDAVKLMVRLVFLPIADQIKSTTLEFDFMLSNRPYGKSWKSDQKRMGGKGEIAD